jgi:AcrR family transcriptional regulator
MTHPTTEGATTEGTTRAAQAAATRARILAAAMRLADASGDEAVRILDVAAASKVSTGALYHHFANREELLAAVHLERYRGSLPKDLAFIEQLFAEAPDRASLKTGLMQLTRMVHSPERAGLRRHRAATIGLSQHQPQLAAALADEQRRTNEAMIRAIEGATQRGLIDAAFDPAAIGTMFQAIALGLVVADIDPGSAPSDEAWDRLVSSLLDAIIR